MIQLKIHYTLCINFLFQYFDQSNQTLLHNKRFRRLGRSHKRYRWASSTRGRAITIRANSRKFNESRNKPLTSIIYHKNVDTIKLFHSNESNFEKGTIIFVVPFRANCSMPRSIFRIFIIHSIASSDDWTIVTGDTLVIRFRLCG